MVNKAYPPRALRRRKRRSIDVEATDQLRRPRQGRGRGHARGVRPLRPRRHPASGKPGDPGPCAGRVLVLRQFLARCVQERRRRPRHQGTLPHLRLAFGAVRVLRQPALDQGGEARHRRGRLPRSHQLRELEPLRRAAERGAILCRGDHLGSAGRRQVLGAAAQAFQRARAGRDRLFRRADHGPAALAAHARHRAPPDSRRHGCVDGAGLRDRERA